MSAFVAFALLISSQAGVEPPAAQPAPAAKPKKVCHVVEANHGVSTGTNMGPVRICKTQEQWDKLSGKKALATAS